MKLSLGTDRPLLFEIELHPMLHSRLAFSTALVSDVKGFDRANPAESTVTGDELAVNLFGWSVRSIHPDE